MTDSVANVSLQKTSAVIVILSYTAQAGYSKRLELRGELVDVEAQANLNESAGDMVDVKLRLTRLVSARVHSEA